MGVPSRRYEMVRLYGSCFPIPNSFPCAGRLQQPCWLQAIPSD
jgi:hypothetical protein